MDTNNNVYTVVYTTVVVVLVAAILAVVSQSLKARQDANEKADTISQMLTAAGFGTKAEFQKMGNDAVIAKYREEIASAYTIDLEGKSISDLSIEDAEIYTPAMLKKQNYLIKGMQEGSVALPVFEFKNEVTVVPVYGAGLWGPIWGYIAFNRPEGGVVTVKGAYFDHESETAGLGSKIKDDPSFQAEFNNAIPEFDSKDIIRIVKGGAPRDAQGNDIQDNQIDAITGATMTSRGLEQAIGTWLQAYSKHFQISATLLDAIDKIGQAAHSEEPKDQEE